MVLTIVIGVIAGWFVVALAVALIIGRAVALGEHEHRRVMSTRLPIDRPRRPVDLVASAIG